MCVVCVCSNKNKNIGAIICRAPQYFWGRRGSEAGTCFSGGIAAHTLFDDMFVSGVLQGVSGVAYAIFAGGALHAQRDLGPARLPAPPSQALPGRMADRGAGGYIARRLTLAELHDLPKGNMPGGEK